MHHLLLLYIVLMLLLLYIVLMLLMLKWWHVAAWLQDADWQAVGLMLRLRMHLLYLRHSHAAALG
jgi:hypothetical protein